MGSLRKATVSHRLQGSGGNRRLQTLWLLMETAMELAVILFWTILCGVCAAVAAGRGRSGLNWFLISFFLIGPVIALVIVCSIDRKGEPELPAARTGEEDHYARNGARFRPQHHSYL
jgi:hypothetical protein